MDSVQVRKGDFQSGPRDHVGLSAQKRSLIAKHNWENVRMRMLDWN